MSVFCSSDLSLLLIFPTEVIAMSAADDSRKVSVEGRKSAPDVDIPPEVVGFTVGAVGVEQSSSQAAVFVVSTDVAISRPLTLSTSDELKKASTGDCVASIVVVCWLVVETMVFCAVTSFVASVNATGAALLVSSVEVIVYTTEDSASSVELKGFPVEAPIGVEAVPAGVVMDAVP